MTLSLGVLSSYPVTGQTPSSSGGVSGVETRPAPRMKDGRQPGDHSVQRARRRVTTARQLLGLLGLEDAHHFVRRVGLQVEIYGTLVKVCRARL